MKICSHAYRFLVLFFLATYLISFAYHGDMIQILTSLALVTIIFSSIAGLGKMVRMISIPMFVAGIAVLVICKAPLIFWSNAMCAGSGLISVCIVAKVLSLPFYYNDYQSDLKKMSHRYINHLIPFLIITMLLVHIMGVFINIAAIPLVYKILEKNAKLYKADRLFAMAVMQGYITTAFWSPTWPAVPLSLSRFQLMWYQIIPYGILMAASCLLVSIVCLLLFLRKDMEACAVIHRNYSVTPDWRNIRTFAFVGVTLLATISVVNAATGWSLFLIISISALPYAITMAVAQNKMKELAEGLKSYYKHDLGDLGGEILLFSACSFFAMALTLLDFSRITNELMKFDNQPFTLCSIIIAGMVILSMVGINGLTTSSVMIYCIDPTIIGLSPIAFSLTMMAGYGLTALGVPFTATALLTSKLTMRPLWEVSAVWNWRFIVMAIPLLSLIISCINK